MSNFKDLINSSQPVLVDFFAQWCGPCKSMGPILDQVAEKVKNQAKIIKVDIDKNPDAAHTYGIQGVPTLILFKNGQILWRKSGVVQPHMLIQLIQQYL